MKKRICKTVALIFAAVILAVMMTVSVSAAAQTFTTVDGGTAALYSSDYELTVSVFGRTTCYNTMSVLSNIRSGGVDQKSNVKVNFIDIDFSSKETVSAFRDEYSGSGISFCYDTTATANNCMWDLAEYAGFSDGITLPLTVFADAEGNVIEITSGLISESYIVAKTGGNYSEFTLKVSGKANYDYAYEVLERLNSLRSSLGLGKLTMNKELLDVAMQRAAETAVYYSHTRPDGSSCFTVYNDYTMGENIAIGQATPESVMTDWTNSPGHYANMTSDSFNSVGIGAFEMSDGTMCWVQFFGGSAVDSYTTSGIKSVTADVTAIFSNMDMEISLEDDSKLLLSGDTTRVKVVNYNLMFGIAEQALSLSDFTFSTKDTDIITVTTDGKVTVKKSGDATITATAKDNSAVTFSSQVKIGHTHIYSSYFYIDKKATTSSAGSKSRHCTVSGCKAKTDVTAIAKIGKISLSASEYTYDGSVKNPYVTVKDSNGASISSYTLSYSSGCKMPGRYAVKITFNGAYSGEKKVYFTIAPKATSKITAATSTSAIKLTWKKVTGADGYRVYQYNSKTKKWEKVKTITSGSTVSYKVKNLKAGTTYKFKVKAYKKAGDVTIWGNASGSFATATKPGVTSKITSVQSASAIKLTWKKVSGADGYRVYQYNSKTKKWEKIKTTSSTSFKVTGLKAGKTYKFKVKAYKKVNGTVLWGGSSKTFTAKTKSK